MRTYLDCIPCFLEQALRAARMMTNDEEKVKNILNTIVYMVPDIPLSSTPPEIAAQIYAKINDIAENHDPYQAIKRESTKRALALYPMMKEYVARANDRLLAAIKVATVGNLIDYGVASNEIKIEHEVADLLEQDFSVCDYEAFRKRLEQAETLLYIGDNAGETVFDRVLIEEIQKPVIYAVRGGPIINDATREDAMQAGLDEVAEIVSIGAAIPGAVLEMCSPEFRSIFSDASLIISKGQGNCEALIDKKGPIFFMLKVKCRVMAKVLGLHEGDIVLKQNPDGYI